MRYFIFVLACVSFLSFAGCGKKESVEDVVRRVLKEKREDELKKEALKKHDLDMRMDAIEKARTEVKEDALKELKKIEEAKKALEDERKAKEAEKKAIKERFEKIETDILDVKTDLKDLKKGQDEIRDLLKGKSKEKALAPKADKKPAMVAMKATDSGVEYSLRNNLENYFDWERKKHEAEIEAVLSRLRGQLQRKFSTRVEDYTQSTPTFTRKAVKPSGPKDLWDPGIGYYPNHDYHPSNADKGGTGAGIFWKETKYIQSVDQKKKVEEKLLEFKDEQERKLQEYFRLLRTLSNKMKVEDLGRFLQIVSTPTFKTVPIDNKMNLIIGLALKEKERPKQLVPDTLVTHFAQSDFRARANVVALQQYQYQQKWNFAYLQQSRLVAVAAWPKYNFIPNGYMMQWNGNSYMVMKPYGQVVRIW